MGIIAMAFRNYRLAEHRSFIPFFLITLLIGFMCLQLASCATTPRRYLAFDASLIKEGETSAQVFKIMGPPDARKMNSAGQEEWYYYRVKRHFWQRIPFLGRHLGKEQVDALQLVFQSDRVQKVIYYVPKT